jgi:hypothetical protein
MAFCLSEKFPIFAEHIRVQGGRRPSIQSLALDYRCAAHGIVVCAVKLFGVSRVANIGKKGSAFGWQCLSTEDRKWAPKSPAPVRMGVPYKSYIL